MSLTEKYPVSCIHRAQTSPSHLQPYTTWFNALENNNAYLIHKTPATSTLTYIIELCCQYFLQELKHKRVCLIIVVHWQFFFCNSFPNSFHFHLLQFIFPFLHTLLSDIKEKKTPLIECKIQKRLAVLRVKFWFLPFESVKRLPWCYHSNEPSLTVLSYGMYLLFSIL